MRYWDRNRKKPVQPDVAVHLCPHGDHKLQLDWPGIAIRLCLACAASLHDTLGGWIAVNRPVAEPAPRRLVSVPSEPDDPYERIRELETEVDSLQNEIQYPNG